MKNIILDLDLTLVDTSYLEQYRQTRKWNEAYSNIHKCHLYDGMDEVFNFIRQNSIKVCIVCNAPKTYVERIVRHFRIPVNHIVGYHDTTRKKPAPDPMIKALQLLNCNANETISFGDSISDMIATKAAHITAVACTWGSYDSFESNNKHYDYIINRPIDIISLL